MSVKNEVFPYTDRKKTSVITVRKIPHYPCHYLVSCYVLRLKWLQVTCFPLEVTINIRVLAKVSAIRF